VRGVMLPAAMKLLGKWNWYLPSWLEWLPKGPAMEGSPEPPEREPLRPRPEARPAEA
jgi:putative drug exporter of the RND superfamily